MDDILSKPYSPSRNAQRSCAAGPPTASKRAAPASAAHLKTVCPSSLGHQLCRRTDQLRRSGGRWRARRGVRAIRRRLRRGAERRAGAPRSLARRRPIGSSILVLPSMPTPTPALARRRRSIRQTRRHQSAAERATSTAEHASIGGLASRWTPTPLPRSRNSAAAPSPICTPVSSTCSAPARLTHSRN